jgi:hypothetical protein
MPVFVFGHKTIFEIEMQILFSYWKHHKAKYIPKRKRKPCDMAHNHQKDHIKNEQQNSVLHNS